MTKPIPWFFQVRVVLNGKTGRTERHLTLPLPPSANQYWRHKLGQVKPYRSAKANEYKENVGWACREAQWEPYTGRIAVQLHLFMNNLASDTDNCQKILLDALIGHAYEDDKQVDIILTKREFDYDNPRVELTMWKIGEEPPIVPRKKKRRIKRG